MLKLFGTTRCRRCGRLLERIADEATAPDVAPADHKLLCPGCGLTRCLVYAYVRRTAGAA